MSPRHTPRATALAAAVATCAVVAMGPAYAGGKGGGNGQYDDWTFNGNGTWNGQAHQGQGNNGPKHPNGPKNPGPKNPDQDPDQELEGSYDGALISTTTDTSSKPTAPPVTAFEMPFPCGQAWTGTTRASHSPSTRSVDWNRTDDFQDPVVAAADGVVITAVTGKNRPSYGQFVVIDHGNNESTLYGHLDSVTVAVGQAVTAGTQIGTLGNTGNSYGAHLHFEERKGSSVIDSWFHGARYVFGKAQESQNCGVVRIADMPLAGNVLGDKRADLVVFRRTDVPGFYVRRDPKAPKVIAFGTPSDQPVLGDWDGNGRVNPGVRTAAGKTFRLKVGKKITEVKFGGRADLAVAGDWDGDGRWEVGTRRHSTNLFRLRASDGSLTKVRLGDADDLPVTGDWDGDGDTDLGVYDSKTATYTLRRVDDSGMEWLSQIGLGESGDLPVVGDWDANGVTDLGIWDPDSASFAMRHSPSPLKGTGKLVRAKYGNGR